MSCCFQNLHSYSSCLLQGFEDNVPLADVSAAYCPGRWRRSSSQMWENIVKNGTNSSVVYLKLYYSLCGCYLALKCIRHCWIKITNVTSPQWETSSPGIQGFPRWFEWCDSLEMTGFTLWRVEWRVEDKWAKWCSLVCGVGGSLRAPKTGRRSCLPNAVAILDDLSSYPASQE